MRRTLTAFVVALLLCSALLHAAGTATRTISDVGNGVTKVSIAWTSTAGGAVSANTFTPRRGRLIQIEWLPGSGGSQPSDLYDVTLVDANSVDFAAGAGANLSNAAGKLTIPSPAPYLDGTLTLDLVVANAGATKTGTVVLWIAPS